MRSTISRVVIAAILAGCGDEPAGPARAADATLAASAAEIAAARIGMDDAMERLAPAVEGLARRTDLRDALDQVRLAIEQRDVRALNSALRRADRALTRLEAADDGSVSADLTALRLQLDDSR